MMNKLIILKIRRKIILFIYKLKKTNIFYLEMIKNFCLNCGEIGHGYKRCKEPTISIGIICIKFSNEEIKNKIIQNLQLNDNKEINKQIEFNKSKIFKKYMNDIKFLLIIYHQNLIFL